MFLDLGQNINSSTDYTRRLFDDFGMLAILIILHIIPIVNLIIYGFMGRVIKETPESNTPPKLEKYGEFWIDGLKISVVAIIYMIIPAVLIAAGAVTLFAPYMAGPYSPVVWLVPLGFGVVLMTVGIILAFAVAIIMAMAIVHLVKTGSFGKAFAVGEIVNIIGKIGWGQYVIWLIVMFIFAIIVGAIGAVPVIGWLISIIVSPIFGVFVSRSAALVYTDAVAPGTTSAAVATTSEKKFCMSCGAQIPAGATFCPVCGKSQ
jgi:ribosomal protein L40E